MTADLKAELEKLTGGYKDEAPEEAEYPYSVFSAKRVSEEDGIQTYSLEINVWDQHRYYSRAESEMDKLEQRLRRGNHRTDKMMIFIFMGNRQNIPDPDKSIKRIREIFTMKVYERDEGQV